MQLGFVRINLAEFAGGGTKEAKLLLDSYNENKRKPDNSVIKVRTTRELVFRLKLLSFSPSLSPLPFSLFQVRLYLRQLSGGPVFNV